MNHRLNQTVLIRSSQPENLHGHFAHEILKTEGLNGFTLVDADTAGWPTFGENDLVLLTRCHLRRAEIGSLRASVEAGARVVCLQPPWELAHAFGWESRMAVTLPGWVQVRDGWPGAGTPLQTHVPVALCEPGEDCEEWEPISAAMDAKWQETGSPAVVRQHVGRGEMTFFFYDLAHAVARLRFGDPQLASLLTTGLWDWPHSTDMFMHDVDERVVHLPQAELHGQLLAAALTASAPQPLARLWYFPEARHETVGVISGDDDWSTPEQFDLQSQSLLQRGARTTYYLVTDTMLSDEHVQRLRDAGHGMGPHVNARAHGDSLYFAFFDQVDEETRAFRERYGEPSATLQCHCAPWMGHLEWAGQMRARGYRMLLNYLTHSALLCRFLCGGGRPIKFPQADGRIIDCWQQPKTNYDDSSIIDRLGNQVEDALADFSDHFAEARKHHSAIGILSHPISFATYSQRYMEGCWDMMVEAGAPLLSADQWCEYQDRRYAVEMCQSIDETGAVRVTVSNTRGPVSLMVPINDDQFDDSVTVNGEAVDATRHHRLGADYRFIAVGSAIPADHIEILIEAHHG